MSVKPNGQPRRTMGDRAAFRLELFSRGGNPHAPTERVFELPCPGLPADARVFGILRSDGADTTATVTSLIRNAIRSIETLNRRTLASGMEGKFEALLLAVNRGYAELAATGTVPSDPLPDALFGMIVENELFLTGRGAVDAFLFRPEEQYQPRPLLEKETSRTDARVLFRTIVSGTLKPTDILLVTVSSLFNYLTLPHLTRVISTLPARDARTRILELLGDVAPSTALSGILVGPPPTDAVRPALSPAIFRRQPSLTPTQAPQQPTPSALQRAIRTLSPTLKKILPTLGGIFTTSVRTLPRLVTRGLTLLREPGARHTIQKQWRTLPDRLVRRWNTLPTRLKLLSITGVLLLLFFGEGIRYLLHTQQNEAAVTAYNQAVAAIQAQRDAAEASMIYTNETDARQKLQEAEAAVHALPQTTTAQQQTVKELLAQIESDREKLRHHTSLQNITPLFTLPTDAGAPTTLFSGKSLITVTSDQGSAWNWDKTKNALAVASAPFLSANTAQRAFLSSHGLLFFTGTDFAERVATHTVRSTLTLPTQEKMTTVTLWKERAYALVPTANQVYRGSRTDSTWNLNTTALKNPTITDATDIAIDTAVWISTSNTIRKYLAGEDQHFQLKPIDPPPQHLSRIWLGADTDPVITFDAPSKRILIINKDGSLRAQWSGGPADDLRDLAIDSAKKSVLLLTSQAVFEIPMPE